MSKRKLYMAGRVLSWVIGILIFIIIMLPLAFYIPWVQNKAKDIACRYVKSEYGWDLRVDHISIKFPLDVSLDNTLLIKENGDTMLAAGNLTAGVAFRPLLNSRVKIDAAHLTHAKYRYVSEDSSMLLTADVRQFDATGGDIDISQNTVNVLDGKLRGGKVHLTMYPYKKVDEPDSVPSEPWKIYAKHLSVEDIDYTMEMMPTIHSLHAHVGSAELGEGYVDTGAHSVTAEYLVVNEVDGNYIYPSAADAEQYEARHPLPPPVQDLFPDTVPWTVRGDSLSLTRANFTYAQRNHTALRGLDPDYISVTDANICLKDFYNREAVVKTTVTRLEAKERCGLEITEGHGTATVNPVDVSLSDFVLKTKGSSLQLDGKADMALLDNPPGGTFNITTNSKVDLNEGEMLMPSLASDIKNIPRNKPVTVRGTFEGNMDNVSIKDGYVELPGHASTKLSGTVTGISDPKRMKARVNLDADINDVEFAKRQYLDKDLQKQFNLVPMKVSGTVDYAPDMVAGDVDIRLKQGGSLRGKGSLALNTSTYSIDATATALPVKKLVPAVDVNSVTAHVKANGHGFDFLSPGTAIDAQVELKSGDYAGRSYRNLNADARLNGTAFDAKVKAPGRGDMAARGTFDPRTMKYDVDAKFNNFPVQEFAPELGAKNLSANVKAKGQNFDFLNRNTSIDAHIALRDVTYNGSHFKDMNGTVSLNGTGYSAHVNSTNPDCNVHLDASGTIKGDNYTVDLKGNVRDLNLQALNLMNLPCDGQGNIDLQGEYNAKTGAYNANMNLTGLNWSYNGQQILNGDTRLQLNASNNAVSAYYNEQSTYLNFDAPMGIDKLSKRFSSVADIALRQVEKMSLDVNEISDAIPELNLSVKMGPNGMVQRFLGQWDIDFRALEAEVHKDSVLHASAWAQSLNVGNTATDTLSLNIDESNGLITFDAHMGNRRGTWDEFAKVDVSGFATGPKLNFNIHQRNIKNETGYLLGLNSSVQDSIVDLSISPRQPIIAYRQWNASEDNYVRLDLGDKRLEADLTLESDSSLIVLRTDPVQEAGKQNILVDIDNVRIEEWTQLIPSLSQMSGVLNADMKFSYDGMNLEGDGDVRLANFTYNGINQGDINMNANLTLDPATAATRLTANLDLDGSNVAVAFGTLNDSTAASPLNLSLNLDRLPLRKLSAFIPGRMVMLDGVANGELTVSGSMDQPFLNGYLTGDSAFVRLPRYGSSLRLSNERINVAGNIINFNNYKIYGLNDKAIDLNGTVDFTDIADINMNLDMTGRNIQFFGSDQKSYSEIFGKGFVDIDGTLKTVHNSTTIGATAKLLSGSDITYVMQDEITDLASRSATEGMVTFVNPYENEWYNDSIVTGAEAAASSMNMLLNLNVEKGAKINAFLQPEGKDRVNIDGSGSLKYTLDFAGKDNLTGTYTINSGTVRYTPPVISQKVFKMIDGSSITWNGEMMNPMLNLKATQSVRSSVANDDGNGSRLVDFDIIAMIDNSLRSMDLRFDLQAKNDAATESDLQTMTDAQRSQAAINMLLYGSYNGISSGSDLASGALFSFLQSQINTWAANNLKGIDVSFGINQYQGSGETSRTETSYSYRLSKSLFDDRFKIVVGGEYSTEATSEQNFSQNLISDISVEYLLNPAGTRYLRLFRHRGLASVLEGEVTVTGLSFVMTHKVGSLWDMFKFLRKTPKLTLPQTPATVAPATETSTPQQEP